MSEVLTPELVIEESNAPLIAKDAATELLATVTPLVARRSEYAAAAARITVKTEADAKSAALLLESIATDSKTVLGAIKAHKDAAKKRHSLWTTFENFFAEPFDAAKTLVKGKIIAWQESERVKAEAEQRRLQAEADAKAEAERQRLLKLAEQRKTDEKKEEYREAAAAVVAPTVTVAAPKSGVKMQRRWVATVTDKLAFCKAIAERPDLAGFVDIQTTALARSKAANPSMLDVPGIQFKQEVV